MSSINNKKAREEREKIIVLKHKFENRITIVRYGKEALDNNDYATAIKSFVEYMEVMSEIKQVKDFYALKVSHFNPKADVTEMLMISHVFFEMARIYDAVPKYKEESKQCLDQFVHFSANQPYQVVNSELVRKHLKKSLFKNPEAFRAAHAQIFVQSKKCYVVTFCYGNEHHLTQEFRLFKDWLLESSLGFELVRIYYKYSSVLVNRWESNRIMQLTAKIIVKPLLVLFSKTVLPFIISK